ncbi:MAG: hypothetical protein MPW14_20665 [Candidatus Manganitrophus sp.]|nr:hypothetical protein [Candidatus Manganitrophus sp.]MDC4225711.1 hypothetical protein [Candidatus Manganitrophus sp.]WDT72962.1 MAG: hypothetical protein MPW17_09025 [Candidatus Manganitrophus sp.]WDT74823.1 MAG: hypothetical protein MPW16_16355 [Candidatus Manganitrophus sp.]WDT79522.1 MAG: hypothetical protein MPW14_20665 [Candidatus Manganitrophus sp.]
MLKLIASIFIPLMALNLSPVSILEPPSPVISDLDISPASGPAGSIYTISLRIASQGGIVPLLHQVREGREELDIPLRDDGLEGDVKKGDGIYIGHSGVPPRAARQTHRFEVFVQDHAGRKSNVLEYRFTVLKGAGV